MTTDAARTPAASFSTWSEAERIAALNSYAMIGTPAEPDFDDLVQLAADAFAAPIAVINLIAGDRQWFKAQVGLGVQDMPLDLSICTHALSQDDVLAIPDTTLDDRVAANPLVTAHNGLRFYAGALLRTPKGIPIGTLCVLDRQPRPDGITPQQRHLLTVLARQAMTQMELRRIIALTDRRADDLRSVEERYRLAGRATNDAIWDWDLQTDQVQWNEAIERTYGFDLATVEPTGAWWIAHIHPDDRDRISAGIHDATDSNAIHWSDEYRFARADGGYAPVLDRGFIIRDASGRATRMVGAMLDLTERRDREVALQTSNERFEAAVEAIDGYLWTNSAEGKMHGPQPGWAKLTGQSQEAYQGYGWADAVHPQDAQPSIDAWDEAVAARKMFIFEHRVLCADGQWRRFSIRAVPMFDADGTLREWVGIHTKCGCGSWMISAGKSPSPMTRTRSWPSPPGWSRHIWAYRIAPMPTWMRMGMVSPSAVIGQPPTPRRLSAITDCGISARWHWSGFTPDCRSSSMTMRATCPRMRPGHSKISGLPRRSACR
jgi:PAS domain S-box-containing protein